MANHEKWMELTILEKIDLVGKVTHLLQNDEESYDAFKKWVNASELLGLFNEIKINEPKTIEND